ncbi:MAG: cytochrome C [Planctomycetes bacterium]|nr:cytochrome C [Planctomycetota bacterium]
MLCLLAGRVRVAADPAPPAAAAAEAPAAPAADPHAQVFAESQYPSAAACASCHQQIYEEWSSSNHAYASISPMFHKFEQRITDLAQGTVGYFCMRCHGTVGTILNEPRELPLWQRSPVSREGVTCITCHRVREEYNKSNGERRIEPGDIHEPVYGGIGGDGVAQVVAAKDAYKVRTGPDDKAPGVPIHRAGIKFEQLGRSEFCVSCHQVAVYPGIKLEVVWDQYRHSPAFDAGVRCQDCHMGKVPGVPSGFAKGAVASINGKAVNSEREHHHHGFFGPGYPIAHPGIFPHNPLNDQFEIPAWLKFDYRAGWGTDDFETQVEEGALKVEFPEEWSSVDDRQSAREIVDANLKRLEEKRKLRLAVMENGSRLDGPFFDAAPAAGQPLRFHYRMTNLNPGHNLPSGSLGAQPEIWLNVALLDPDGKNVWESGYVDKHGDMADLHSQEVAAGRLPHDDQLVNLQTKFLTTNVKGTDREMYLPINVDVDQLPFIRPAGLPISVLNHPPFIRMEGRSLPPLAVRKAVYKVPAAALARPGAYRLAVRLRSRAEPIYFMQFCGSTADMDQSMNEWMIDIHPYTVEFDVK